MIPPTPRSCSRRGRRARNLAGTRARRRAARGRRRPRRRRACLSDRRTGSIRAWCTPRWCSRRRHRARRRPRRRRVRIRRPRARASSVGAWTFARALEPSRSDALETLETRETRETSTRRACGTPRRRLGRGTSRVERRGVAKCRTRRAAVGERGRRRRRSATDATGGIRDVGAIHDVYQHNIHVRPHRKVVSGWLRNPKRL